MQLDLGVNAKIRVSANKYNYAFADLETLKDAECNGLLISVPILSTQNPKRCIVKKDRFGIAVYSLFSKDYDRFILDEHKNSKTIFESK